MSENILEIRHLGKSFGTHEVLRDIDFTVKKGDVISIIGASGSGKMLLCCGGVYYVSWIILCTAIGQYSGDSKNSRYSVPLPSRVHVPARFCAFRGSTRYAVIRPPSYRAIQSTAPSSGKSSERA